MDAKPLPSILKDKSPDEVLDNQKVYSRKLRRWKRKEKRKQRRKAGA